MRGQSKFGLIGPAVLSLLLAPLVACGGGGGGGGNNGGGGGPAVGDGTFSPASSPTVSGLAATQVLAVADLNADGKDDIVQANTATDTIQYAFGGVNGLGTAATRSTTDAPSSLAVGDFDQDGDVDVAVWTGVRIEIFETHLTINLTTSLDLDQFISGTPAPGTNCLVAGNYGVDQDTDLVYGFLGTLHHSFGGTGLQFQASTDIGPGGFTSPLVSADMNGNGSADLVAIDLFGSVIVRGQQGNGTFAAAQSFPLATTPTKYVALGDVNGDGRKDVVVGMQGIVGQPQRFVVLRNSSTGGILSFDSAMPIDVLATSGSASGLAVADFNGDGFDDVAIGDPTAGTVRVMLSNGTGSAFTQSQAVFCTGVPTAVAAGDWNGDGVADLAISSGTDLDVYIGNKQ